MTCQTASPATSVATSATNRCLLLLTFSLFPLSFCFQRTSFVPNPPYCQTPQHHQHNVKSAGKPSFLLPTAPSLNIVSTDGKVKCPPLIVSALLMSSDTGGDTPAAPEIKAAVSIEYCTGCRWMTRAAWMAQELLTTFQDELDEVCLVPSREGTGKFAVTLNGDALWDRKSEGRFPEMKELKRIVRDVVSPDRDLGHSDIQKGEGVDSVDTSSSLTSEDKPELSSSVKALRTTPHISITYCTGCRWMLRAAWMAQELFMTFDDEINSISLLPSRPPQPGGLFTVMLDEDVLWDRKKEGRFPEPKEIKQKIRDFLCPSRDLGHSDVKKEEENNSNEEEMDDDEAAEMRKFFGVS